MIPCLRQRLGLGHSRVNGLAAHGAAGEGDDAVGAEVAASVLHLEHSAGAPHQPAGGEHFKIVPFQRIVHRYPGGGGAIQRGLLHLIQKGHPVAGARHQIHLQPGHFLRLRLGVAAADGDEGVRVGALGAADHVPTLFVADGGDGTGVDDIYIGLCIKLREGVAAAGQNGLHGLGLVLVDLAAQGVNGIAHKNFSLAGIENPSGIKRGEKQLNFLL